MECCVEKVGEKFYKRIDKEVDTSPHDCLNNCIYEEIGIPGSIFCFKTGALTVQCTATYVGKPKLDVE